MKHSSRREPCPVCSRNKDDKCRWNDEMIFCYDGTSFAPPQHLKVGDKVKVGSNVYALFSHQCGFANNSFGFALIDDFDYRFLPYEDKRAYRRKCVSVTRTFIKKRDALNAFLYLIKQEESFHDMTLELFRVNKGFTAKANSLLALLYQYITANKRYIIDYLKEIEKIQGLMRVMDGNIKLMYAFEVLHFGVNGVSEDKDLSSAGRNGTKA